MPIKHTQQDIEANKQPTLKPLLFLLLPVITALAYVAWLGVIPQSERSPVISLVRVHSWLQVKSQSGAVYKKQPIDVSLPLSPSFPPLSKRK